MHIACFHLVTPFVCINQSWWVFHHQVCVVEQSICVSRRWCWLCLQPVIATWNDVASFCEESLKPLESLRDDIIRICPSEPFEGCNDLLSMVCAWDASVKKGSAIGISLIQYSLLECTGPVFYLVQCMCPQSHSSGISNVFDQWAVDTTMVVWSCQCGAVNHGASSVAVGIIPKELCDVPLQQAQCT